MEPAEKPKVGRKKKVKVECDFVNKDGKKCTYKAQPNSTLCGYHVKVGTVLLDEKKGIIHCARWKRGCPEILAPGYEFKTCDECREKDREKDKKKKTTRKTTHIEERERGDDELICTGCGEYKIRDEYENRTKCQDCFVKAQEAEKKRPKRDRSAKDKEYASKEEVKKRRAENQKNRRAIKKEKEQRLAEQNALLMAKLKEQEELIERMTKTNK